MSMNEMFDYEEPCFVISVAARVLGVQTQTLRYYERLGLVEPERRGRQRMYSRRDVERVRRIRTYMDEWGVNLVGAKVAMRLVDLLQEADSELQRLRAENERLKGALSAVEHA